MDFFWWVDEVDFLDFFGFFTVFPAIANNLGADLDFARGSSTIAMAASGTILGGGGRGGGGAIIGMPLAVSKGVHEESVEGPKVG